MKPIKEFPLLELPVEIICCILNYLDLTDIAKVIFVSKFFHLLINKSENGFYWSEKFEFFSYDELKDYLTKTNSTKKKIVVNQFLFKKTLDRCLKPYQTQTRTFFSKQKKLTYKIFEKTFCLGKIYDALLNDDPVTLIDEITNFRLLLPYFVNEEMVNEKETMKLTNILSENNIKIGDLLFVPVLLPVMIKTLSFRCYRTCMKLVFLIYKLFQNMQGDERFFIDRIRSEVFKTHDLYFIRVLLTVSLDYRRSDILKKNLCWDFMKYCIDQKKTDILESVLDDLSENHLKVILRMCFKGDMKYQCKFLANLNLKKHKQAMKVIARYKLHYEKEATWYSFDAKFKTFLYDLALSIGRSVTPIRHAANAMSVEITSNKLESAFNEVSQDFKEMISELKRYEEFKAAYDKDPLGGKFNEDYELELLNDIEDRVSLSPLP